MLKLPRIHPSLRPILLGVALFTVLNLVLTLGVTFSSLNRKFNFSYGNFLPTKLEMLRAQAPKMPDILFLGTSQTNNGFIPSEFEQASNRAISAFNLGLPNNHYDIMLAYLRYHQSHYGKPRVLLLELSPSIMEKSAHLYYLPALYYRTLIEQAPALTTDYLSNPLLADNVKKELFFSSISSLHQYRFTFSPVNMLSKVSQKLTAMAHRGEPSAQAAVSPESDANSPPTASSFTVTPEMTAKGWYPKEQSVHMKTPDGVRLSVAEARKYYIDEQPGVYFDKIKALLSYCREQNIPVVLVSWPNHPAFLSEFERSRLSGAYQQGLAQLLREQPTPMINLNREIPASQPRDNGGLFSDPRHLTPEGAVLFSRKLAQDVLALPQVQAALAR